MKGVNKGIPKSLTHKRNLSISGKGKHGQAASDTARRNMSIARIGLKPTDKTRRKLSEVLIGNSRRKNTGKYKFYTPQGVFYSADGAGNANGVTGTTIINRCIKHTDSVIVYNPSLKVDKSLIGKTWRAAGFYAELR